MCRANGNSCLLLKVVSKRWDCMARIRYNSNQIGKPQDICLIFLNRPLCLAAIGLVNLTSISLWSLMKVYRTIPPGIFTSVSSCSIMRNKLARDACLKFTGVLIWDSLYESQNKWSLIRISSWISISPSQMDSGSLIAKTTFLRRHFDFFWVRSVSRADTS